MTYNKKAIYFNFLVSIFLCILAGAEMDIFIPSFIKISKEFDLTPFMTQLTLSINFTAYCFFGLFAAALGDRYGRRPVLCYSLIVFIAGSVFSFAATNFTTLLVGRFFQGIGIAGPAVLGYLIVADVCPPKWQPKLFGILNGVVTSAIALAPIAGSYITLYFNWRGNFTFLFLLGLFCFILCFFIDSSEKQDNAVSLSLNTYRPLLASKKVWAFILAITFLSLPYGVFIGISPFLYMGVMRVSLKHFGYYQGIISFFFATMCFASPTFFSFFGYKKCFYAGIILCVISSCLFFANAFINILNPGVVTAVMLISALGAVFPTNILYPYSLEAFKDNKGKFTALILFSRLALTALFVEIVGFFYNQDFFSLGMILSLTIFSMILIVRFLLKKGWFSFDSYSKKISDESPRWQQEGV